MAWLQAQKDMSHILGMGWVWILEKRGFVPPCEDDQLSYQRWPEAEIMKKIAANPVDERMG